MSPFLSWYIVPFWCWICTSTASPTNFTAIECPLGCMNDEAIDCINNGYDVYYKSNFPASSFCSLSDTNCGNLMNGIKCPDQCIPLQQDFGCKQCIRNGYKCYYINDNSQLYPFCSSDTFILSSDTSDTTHKRDHNKETHIHYNIHNHYKIYKYINKNPESNAYFIGYAQCPTFCIEQAKNCSSNDTLCYLQSLDLPQYTICVHYPLNCIFPFIPCQSLCLSMECLKCHMNGKQCCFNSTNVLCSDNCVIVNDIDNVEMNVQEESIYDHNMDIFAWLSLLIGVITICILICWKMRRRKGYVSVDTA